MTAVVSISQICAQGLGIELTQVLEIAHRLLLRRHFHGRETRPWKVLHPRGVRCHRVDRLHLRPNSGRIPPVMKLDSDTGMISHPFAGERLGWRVAAMP